MPALNTYSLHHWLQSNIGFQLIDVQPRRAYRQAHLPSAENIPVDDPDFERLVTERFQRRASELVGGKIVVYGEGGPSGRAHQAAERLRQAGFRAVYEYGPGLEGWLHAGNPVRTGSG